jgi:Protein of unknown function (DUF2934)
MTDRDQRIRDIAYFLWLEDGCPEGEHERHWQTAEGLVDSEPVEGEANEGEASNAPKKPFPSATTSGSD